MNKNETNNQTIYLKEFSEAIVRVFFTSTFVASVVYPLEVLHIRMQVDAKLPLFPNSFSFRTPLAMNYRIFYPLLNGYFHANKASIYKNTVIAQKDTVNSQVENAIGEVEPMSTKSSLNHPVNLQTIMVIRTGIASSIIAGIDTAATQKSSNIRILSAIGIQPLPNTTMKKLKLFSNGFTARFIRNNISTFACISTSNILPDALNPIISSKEHPVANSAIATILAGCATSFLVNPIEVIYKRAIASMNPETLNISYRQVISNIGETAEKQLIPSLRILFKGSGMGCIYGTTVFGAINAASFVVDEYMFPKQSSTTDRISFFSPLRLTSKTPETQGQDTRVNQDTRSSNYPKL